MKRKIDNLVIHCSDSLYGSVEIIDGWHKQRGWQGIGYHYVILNSYPDRSSHDLRRPRFDVDGRCDEGRPVDVVGAHVKGHNAHSIGICLIGKTVFSYAQLNGLRRIIETLLWQIGDAAVVGHYELDPKKTCPNIDMDWLRKLLV